MSTGAVKTQPAWQTSTDWFNAGISSIELSGGAFHRDQLALLVKLKKSISFQLHNYFPPPEKPFVFNLASLQPEIAHKSMDHVEIAMQWALELDRPRYGFHAGFLLDPRVDELGKRICRRDMFDRQESMKVFIDRLNKLGDRAKQLGVELLIENNVLSASNFKEFDGNPFLMVTDEECLHVMAHTPSNVNLLIDVAHLKVSAQSLGFDPITFLKKCNNWISGYHLSDNDGFRDSNHPVSERSWFWPYLKLNLDYYTLEVNDLPLLEMRNQYILVDKKIRGLNELS
jgi:sugar phosphate isomerase/epimerase